MITLCIFVVYFVVKGVAHCFRLQQEVFSNQEATDTFEVNTE